MSIISLCIINTYVEDKSGYLILKAHEYKVQELTALGTCTKLTKSEFV